MDREECLFAGKKVAKEELGGNTHVNESSRILKNSF